MAELGELGEASAALVVLKADLNFNNFAIFRLTFDLATIWLRFRIIHTLRRLGTVC